MEKYKVEYEECYFVSKIFISKNIGYIDLTRSSYPKPSLTYIKSKKRSGYESVNYNNNI